jgi:putative transposase
MARQPRCAFAGATYHVLNRFVNKHPFFQADHDYEFFLRTYYETAAMFGIRTFTLCLMPNHFHLCLQTPEANISSFLQRLMTRVAVRMNLRLDHSGHLFQGRTQTLPIFDENYFETVVAYILMNPVRAGLCSDPFAYPWSSAHQIAREDSRVDWKEVAERVAGRKIGESRSEHAAIIVRWLRDLETLRNAERFRSGYRAQKIAAAEFAKRTMTLPVSTDAMSSPDKRRRRLDLPKSSWNWNDIRATAESVTERFTFESSTWLRPADDLAVFLAFSVGRWSYERIRHEDPSHRTIGTYTMIVKRMRKNTSRREAAEIALARVGARP